jgi:glutathione S-transferase
LAGPFSLADIAFIPNLDTLERIQVQVDPKYNNIHAWTARLKARPSFAASAT